MKSILKIMFLVVFQISYSQTTLSADGSGETYELITSALAPGYKPYEVPDCGHPTFGRHIDEIFDDELDKYVFRFHIHVSSDNDRCKNYDRQRNEIKTYRKSPDSLLGHLGEKFVYKWKFKLDVKFQPSKNFTHVHQLKSVDDIYKGKPMYAITARKGSPNKLQLRYSQTDKYVTLAEANLEPFTNTWLEATETITYKTSGTYKLEIKRVKDGKVLFAYNNDNIINWREGASFVRPKWGIYRSLKNAQDLRDEKVLFADFSIKEIK